MEKKKAIKIVTATAIAASTFAAVAPAPSQAATSLTKQISATKAAMKKPYDKYVKATSLVSIKTIESYIASAKKAEAATIKSINSAKISAAGKKKLTADVKKYEVYITRAQGYVTAYKAATTARNGLNTLVAELNKALEAKDVAAIEKQIAAIQAAITTAQQNIKDTVYGANIETLLFDKFTKSAETSVASAQTVLADLKAVPAVESVSATNATTLTLTGTKLDKLTAADVTVSDNTVKSFTASADGKTATVVLNVELVDGETATVKVGDKTLTVNYKLEVKSVEVKAASYDDNTAKQYVKLVVGGKEVTASDLIAAGYNVEFSAFTDKAGTTSVSIFNDTATGLLNDVIPEATLTGATTATGASVYVGVTATKGSEVLSSGLQKLTIQNQDLATQSIESVTLQDGAGIEKLSNTILTTETATISKIKVKTDTVSEDITDNTLFTAKSSNPAVATVSGGTITPVAPGTATITVTYGNATKTLQVTVAEKARELSSIQVISKDDVKYGTQLSSKTIPATVGGTVYVKPVDQYGDLYSGAGVTASSSNTAAVTTGALDDTDGNGIYSLPLSGVDTGSAYITFKDADNFKVTSNAFKVTTTADNTASTYKLELSYADNAADKLKDTKINIGDAEDAALTYKLVGYTSEGVKLSAVDLSAATITVAQSSAIVNTTVNGDGNLEITPDSTKTGTATVTVTFNGKKYSQLVTVVNEPTKISSVTLKTIASPTYVKEYTYKDVFTYTASGADPILKNVTVSPASSQPVRYDDTADVIYLDKNANGIFDGTDVNLGTLVYSFVDATTGVATGTTDTYTTATGDEGTLVIKVLDADGKVIKSSSVNVNL